MNFNSCLIDTIKVKCMNDFLDRQQNTGSYMDKEAASQLGACKETAAQRRARLRKELEAEEAEAAERESLRSEVRLGLNVLRLSTVGTLNQLQALISTFMTAQGFWESDNTAEKIALMHSELSEAMEAHRKQIRSDDKIPQFDGVTAELADTVIRIFDFAGHHRLALGEAIIAKMLVNVDRPYKHNKLY